MFRTLVAVAILLTVPGGAAWAQVAEVARLSAPVEAPALALPLSGTAAAPALTGALAAPSLGEAPALSAPAATEPYGEGVPLPHAVGRRPIAPAAAPEAAVPVPAAAALPTEARPAGATLGRLRPVAFSAAEPLPSSSEDAAASGASLFDGLSRWLGRLSSRAAAVQAPETAPQASGLAAATPASEKADDAAPPAPRTPAAPAPRLWGYLSGTFGAQLASNALQVSMPLLFLKMTGSASHAAFAVFAGAAADALGTRVGGNLVDRHGAKKVLLGTTLVRGAAMAVLPVLALGGGLTLPAVAAAYLVEGFARGVADTARSALPSELAGRDEGLLKRVLAKNQTFFESGGIAGPFLVGALIAGVGGVAAPAALWLAPAALAATTLAYAFIPRRAAAPAAEPGAGAPSVSPLRDGWTRWALAATALLTMYPLKGVLPAIFATQVLGSPASAAWLAGLFGVGGVAGSLAYARWGRALDARTWMAGGAAGLLALAAAFLPGGFWPAAAGVLVFAALNVGARLSLSAAIQTRAGPGRAGAAMASARFTANLTSMALRFAAGLAFAAFAVPSAAFWLIGGGLAAVAAAEFYASRHLAVLAAAGAAASLLPGARLSPVTGLPGRLIVVEGLDGSGKSTQLERLKELLEAKGLKVVATGWNSSEVVSDAVKKAKKEHSLTPQTFALLNASDLADRLDKVILPALKNGEIVLADRWFFTALARDRTRGMDAAWLKRLYAFAPKPDLTLYFRLPVATAVSRVLARSSGRVGLSEDFDESSGGKVLGQNWYAAGRDMRFAEDDAENFREFQTRVAASYDAQAREYGFRRIDAARGRDEVSAETQAAVLKALGDLASFRRAVPASVEGTFDKDPAGDAPNIRRNYAKEKRGVHFYFRNMLLPMQARFAELMDMASMPRVLLHGSPHVDNYAKSKSGAAMVDFDRSRVGPYAWDLVRLMVSLSLRAKKEPEGLLDAEVLHQLRKGYGHGLRHPDRPFSEARLLKDVEPKPGETSVDAYLKDGKWAQEMRSRALPVDDPDVVALVSDYARRRGDRAITRGSAAAARRREAADGLLTDYRIEEAGRGEGSMGFRSLYLVVLAPKDPASGRDRILLNIKQVRSDPDDQWYKNPYPDDIERMTAASELYAPGWEAGKGGAVLDGVEYYVREIPPQNAKIKKMLKVSEQADLAYAVGTQLGRAHRLSLQDGGTPADLERALDAQFDGIVAAGLTIRREIEAAYARYVARMKRDGLEPGGAGDGE
ncbi:MAG: dTMP kinase [Elusimicrobia bacterium]|nr:dTMP kinase [Elusimicrobiota bacterium]